MSKENRPKITLESLKWVWRKGAVTFKSACTKNTKDSYIEERSPVEFSKTRRFLSFQPGPMRACRQKTQSFGEICGGKVLQVAMKLNTAQIDQTKNVTPKAPCKGAMNKKMISGFSNGETKWTDIRQKGEVVLNEWDTSIVGTRPVLEGIGNTKSSWKEKEQRTE